MIDDRQLDQLIKGLHEILTSDKVEKVALLSIHQLTAKRIFQDGIKANGDLIGTYSKGYQKIRQKKNYPISKKIILQATGQMVNDYSFLVNEEGVKYGSGFKLSRNGELSEKLEKRFGPIWKLTESEQKKIPQAYEDALNQILR